MPWVKFWTCKAKFISNILLPVLLNLFHDLRSMFTGNNRLFVLLTLRIKHISLWLPSCHNLKRWPNIILVCDCACLLKGWLFYCYETNLSFSHSVAPWLFQLKGFIHVCLFHLPSDVISSSPHCGCLIVSIWKDQFNTILACDCVCCFMFIFFPLLVSLTLRHNFIVISLWLPDCSNLKGWSKAIFGSDISLLRTTDSVPRVLFFLLSFTCGYNDIYTST